jgi:cell division inhibitor SulA
MMQAPHTTPGTTPGKQHASRKEAKGLDTARRSVVEVADLSRDTNDTVSEAADEGEPRSVSLRTVLTRLLNRKQG